MRGAPQVGFSATIRKIKARTSLLTCFRPPTWLILETHVQYKRKPAMPVHDGSRSDQDERPGPPGELPSARRETPEAPRVKAALIEKKGCRKGAKMHPFAPTLVAVKDVKLF